MDTHDAGETPTPEDADKARKRARRLANLRRGNPGNRGGMPEWFREKLRAIGSHPRTLLYITECLEGEHGPSAAIAAWGHCLRYGLGEQQSLSVSARLTTASLDKLLPLLSDEQLLRLKNGEQAELILAEMASAGAAKILPPGREIEQPGESGSADAPPQDGPEK
jgi:hypothetical protein